MSATIREIGLKEIDLALQVLNHLPEFDALFYRVQLEKRLSKSEAMLFIAEVEGRAVGCKLAYNRYFDGSVYSWLGGVLPEYRKQGIATALLHELERVARKKLFLSLRMKTRNKHKAMLCFAIKNGFQLTEITAKAAREESRIELVKQL